MIQSNISNVRAVRRVTFAAALTGRRAPGGAS